MSRASTLRRRTLRTVVTRLTADRRCDAGDTRHSRRSCKRMHDPQAGDTCTGTSKYALLFAQLCRLCLFYLLLTEHSFNSFSYELITAHNNLLTLLYTSCSRNSMQTTTYRNSGNLNKPIRDQHRALLACVYFHGLHMREHHLLVHGSLCKDGGILIARMMI